MNKKAFTLIELLAVIVILAIILVIAVPQIMKIIEEARIGSYNSQVELIKKAADLYRTQYQSEISNLNDVSISIDKLIEKGLMKNIINPITKQPFDTGMNIRMVTDANGTNYEIYEGPELVTGMIPVYYDDVNYVWKKADKSNLNNTWYDYNNYKWANAVTVISSTRATHNSAAVNAIIPMTDINTMFVWIPRFKYRIPAGTGPREIEVMLENKFAKKTNGNAITTYYTHPAFTVESEELNGVWVGKFETTGTIDDLTIKPDLQAVRSQTIKYKYESIKTNMQGNAIYGFARDSDAHIMKNMEWGAVTYLYHSKYGKYGNSLYTIVNKELYLNNSSGNYTGRSMGGPGGAGPLTPTYEYIADGNYTYDGKCAYIYTNLSAPCNVGSIGQILTDKTLSYGASTTGTIYGIYDMSGGAWEYVMGMYMPNPVPATGIADLSGYSTTTTDSQYNLLNINAKYYDRYLTAITTTGAILGDATKEVSGWYADNANFVNASSPWFGRGGYYSNIAGGGAFYFDYNTGGTSASRTFRIVIWPQA